MPSARFFSSSSHIASGYTVIETQFKNVVNGMFPDKPAENTPLSAAHPRQTSNLFPDLFRRHNLTILNAKVDNGF
jgi:hypothetical protein